MITFPASYGVDPKNFINGRALLFYAPYVAGGADPATGNLVSMGMLGKAGVKFGNKRTYLSIEADQFATEVDAFLTKQEFTLGAALEEISPSNMNIILGATAASLVSGGGTSAVQNLGDVFDPVSTTAAPSNRPPYRCWTVVFPSPGHDNQTSPIGINGYVQFFKAFVESAGDMTFSRSGNVNCPIVLKAVIDPTVSGAPRIGKIQFQ